MSEALGYVYKGRGKDARPGDRAIIPYGMHGQATDSDASSDAHGTTAVPEEPDARDRARASIRHAVQTTDAGQICKLARENAKRKESELSLRDLKQAERARMDNLKSQFMRFSYHNGLSGDDIAIFAGLIIGAAVMSGFGIGNKPEQMRKAAGESMQKFVERCDARVAAGECFLPIPWMREGSGADQNLTDRLNSWYRDVGRERVLRMGAATAAEHVPYSLETLGNMGLAIQMQALTSFADGSATLNDVSNRYREQMAGLQKLAASVNVKPDQLDDAMRMQSMRIADPVTGMLTFDENEVFSQFHNLNVENIQELCRIFTHGSYRSKNENGVAFVTDPEKLRLTVVNEAAFRTPEQQKEFEDAQRDAAVQAERDAEQAREDDFNDAAAAEAEERADTRSGRDVSDAGDESSKAQTDDEPEKYVDAYAQYFDDEFDDEFAHNMSMWADNVSMIDRFDAVTSDTIRAGERFTPQDPDVTRLTVSGYGHGYEPERRGNQRPDQAVYDPATVSCLDGMTQYVVACDFGGTRFSIDVYVLDVHDHTDGEGDGPSTKYAFMDDSRMRMDLPWAADCANVVFDQVLRLRESEGWQRVPEEWGMPTSVSELQELDRAFRAGADGTRRLDVTCDDACDTVTMQGLTYHGEPWSMQIEGVYAFEDGLPRGGADPDGRACVYDLQLDDDSYLSDQSAAKSGPERLRRALMTRLYGVSYQEGTDFAQGMGSDAARRFGYERCLTDSARDRLERSRATKRTARRQTAAQTAATVREVDMDDDARKKANDEREMG